jgi:hypothetical protein
VFKKTANFSEAVEIEQVRLLSEAEALGTDSPDYARKLEMIAKLDNVKVKKTHLSKDAILSASASILGMLLVISYERNHAITTKAFGLVKKP